MYQRPQIRHRGVVFRPKHGCFRPYAGLELGIDLVQWTVFLYHYIINVGPWLQMTINNVGGC